MKFWFPGWPAFLRASSILRMSAIVGLLGLLFPWLGGAQEPRFDPAIPRVWDDAVLADLELPLSNPEYSPKHVSARFYEALKVMPIYRSYDVYHPEQEPEGYFEALQKREPVVLWDSEGTRPKLETRADWIAAGELVFDTPIVITADGHLAATGVEGLIVRDRKFYEYSRPPLTTKGRLPFYRYVVREKGNVEVGILACAMCHTRVMPDGLVIKGAQGNFPFGKAFAYSYTVPPLEEPGQRAARGLQRLLYHVPWNDHEGLSSMEDKSFADIAAWHARVPAGVLARHRSHPGAPVQVPDLIGIKSRSYLDRSGLQRHRDIGDLMRYAALNQGGDDLASFGEFVPFMTRFGGGQLPDSPPPGASRAYSDEQLYALALYLYDLQPPPSPHPFNDLARRGREVFEAESCNRCHEPPDYTNNELTPAEGFSPPDDHPEREVIMRRRVGTDPTLTMQTRRGTGLYKVPSLKGVWYRSMFGHSGWCATLEDWFDPARLKPNYRPTGWPGPPGTETMAVPGHEFGLDLSEGDRRALIAFLKTL